MKKRIHRKNARLYCKQGLLALLLLILTVYLGLASSIIKSLFPPTVNQLSEIVSKDFSHRNRFVRLQCSQLYYTGYDNHKAAKATGHYYYALEDNHCFFFLINSGKAAPEETLTNYKGTFQLSKDETLYHDLTASLAKDMNWASQSLRNISPPIILSQPDYHFRSLLLYALALLACTILFTLSAIYNFSRYYHCRKHNRSTEHRTHTKTPL